MSFFAIRFGVVLLVVLVSAWIVPVGAQRSGDGLTLRVEDTVPDATPSGGINLRESIEGNQSPEQLKQAIGRLARGWSALSAKLPFSSDSTLVVRTWRDEAARAMNCLDTVVTQVSTSDQTPETIDLRAALEPCIEASGIVEGLVPAIAAIARGENSAVLVITSVGCECVLAACERMSAIRDSLLASDPESLPLAKFDEMALPHLAEGWDLYEAPSWVFLGPAGDQSFLLEGNIENSVVLSEIEGWVRRVSEKRGLGEHE